MIVSLFTSVLVLIQGVSSAPLVAGRPAPRVQQEQSMPFLMALTGQVLNEAGAPLPGVIIAVQGSPTTTSTNADGRFLVDAPATEPILVFKCAGFRIQTVVAAASGPLAVTMYALTGTGTDKTTAAEHQVSSGAGAAATLIAADIMPRFTGGDKAYGAFLRQNAKYPAEALKKQVGGKVYVSFVIDEQGRVCDAEVLKGCGNGLDEEALRLVRLMPWWEPGQVAGKPVRVAIAREIKFEAREQ